MNRIALGTAQFGLDYGIANTRGQISLSEAQSILARAKLAGIDTIDTAISYGESQRTLGQIATQEWRIVSKVPSVPESCRDPYGWTRESVKGAIKALNVNKLFGMLLHNVGQSPAMRDESWRALSDLKKEQRIDKIGISIYEPTELELIPRTYSLDIVQAPLSILDRRLVSTGWMKRLTSMSVEIHVRSVFLQGLMLLPPSKRPPQFRRWAGVFARVDRWLHEAHVTPLEACLGFALSFPEIGRVVVGVDTEAQLDQILAATSQAVPPIPDDLLTSDIDLLNPSRWGTL